MVLGGEHENTQKGFSYLKVRVQRCQTPNRACRRSLVFGAKRGRAGWKGGLQEAAAAGAGEAAREAPNTKTRPCRRVFMLGFKGGVEEAWGGTRVWVPPRLQNT